MKRLFTLLLVIVSVVFLYPAKPDSSIYKLQTSLKSIGKSNADYSREISDKRNQLEAYEKAIVSISAQMDSMEENAPICPQTGDKAITTITDDPRDELEEKCERLRAEIQLLEERIKKG